jgi:hypothetical protein
VTSFVTDPSDSCFIQMAGIPSDLQLYTYREGDEGLMVEMTDFSK